MLTKYVGLDLLEISNNYCGVSDAFRGLKLIICRDLVWFECPMDARAVHLVIFKKNSDPHVDKYVGLDLLEISNNYCGVSDAFRGLKLIICRDIGLIWMSYGRQGCGFSYFQEKFGPTYWQNMWWWIQGLWV